MSAAPRSSPPPNLHMIKEDAGDGMEVSQMEQEDGSLKLTDMCDAAKKYAQNPQISITDTHGHEMPVISIQEVSEDAMDEDTSPVSQPKANSPVVPQSGITADSNQPAVSPFSWQSQFGIFSHYAGLNLAGIPPLDHEMDTNSNKPPLQKGIPFTGVYGMPGISPTVLGLNSLGYRTGFHGMRGTLGGGGSKAPTSCPSSPAHLHRDIKGGNDAFMNNYSLLNSLDLNQCRFGNGMNVYNGMQGAQSRVTSALTKRTMSDLMLEIKKALDNRSPDLCYQARENGFLLNIANVMMEMEVYHADSERGLRFRKLQGDTLMYDKLCSELLACMDL